MIPKKGDWVLCKDFEAPGKVCLIDEVNKTFVASFFTEYSCQEDAGGIADYIVSFENIKHIIADKKEIGNLEKELKGAIKWP